LEIFKVFKVSCAHRLPNVPAHHKCAKVHGHTFRIEVHIGGPVDPRMGWILEFADIVEAFRPLQEHLDHKYLNEIEGLENPTSENLARWIWKSLRPSLPGLCRVVVQESPESGCIFTGDEPEP
jgi:6-pyruvoyltetrahydropterin/6-carboxytetrahydropterin synthase